MIRVAINVLFAALIALAGWCSVAKAADANPLNPIAVGQYWNPQTSQTYALNSANARLGFSFIIPDTKTLSKVRFYCVTKNGTANSGTFQLDIYDTSGATALPNTSLSNTTTHTNAASATWVEWSGLTQSITGGSMYWAVAKNLDASPGTNNCTFRRLNTQSMPLEGGGGSENGWNLRTSSDGGSTWTENNITVGATLRLEFDDGTFAGWPIEEVQQINTPPPNNDRVYNSEEPGNKFTTPANVRYRVKCVVFNIGSGATSPSGNLSFKLYTGSSTTATATTNAVALKYVSAGSTGIPQKLCFSSVQTLEPSTVYRVVAANSASDSASNSYRMPYIKWDDESNSLALKPFQGTLSKCRLASGAWTDSLTDEFYPMTLILDQSQPFGVTASKTANFNRGFEP